jgi:hypothetical protein
MVHGMKHVETCTAFYRALRGHGIEHQRKLIEAAVARRGWRIVAEYTAGESGDDRDEWIRRTRATEGAVVAGLYVIPEPASTGPKGKRPSADYAASLMALVQGCAIVVDAESGLTSKDGAKWRALVEQHARKTAAGRKMTRKAARAMAKQRWKDKPPPLKAKWSESNMRRERERWSQHWRDPKFTTGQAAFDALPAALQDEFRTTRRMYDLFGPRDPTGSKGGRPPMKRTPKR